MRIDSFPENLAVVKININVAYHMDELPFNEREILYNAPESDETKLDLYFVCERTIKPARILITSDFPVHVTICNGPYPFQIVVDGPLLLDRENKIESNMMMIRRTHLTRF